MPLTKAASRYLLSEAKQVVAITANFDDLPGFPDVVHQAESWDALLDWFARAPFASNRSLHAAVSVLVQIANSVRYGLALKNIADLAEQFSADDEHVDRVIRRDGAQVRQIAYSKSQDAFELCCTLATMLAERSPAFYRCLVRYVAAETALYNPQWDMPAWARKRGRPSGKA